MKEGLGGYCAEIGAIVMKEGEGRKLRRNRGKGYEGGARGILRRNRRNSYEGGGRV